MRRTASLEEAGRIFYYVDKVALAPRALTSFDSDTDSDTDTDSELMH